MAAAHKITVTLNEAAGALTVRHFATVNGVTVWEDVPADPKLAADLKALIEPNRAAMEGRAAVAAARHLVAASDRAEADKAKAAKKAAESPAE